MSDFNKSKREKILQAARKNMINAAPIVEFYKDLPNPNTCPKAVVKVEKKKFFSFKKSGFYRSLYGQWIYMGEKI